MEILTTEDANAFLQEKNACLRVEKRGTQLSLRGSLPTNSGGKRQRRISLKVMDNKDGLSTAVNYALQLTELVKEGLFRPEFLDWPKLPRADELLPSKISVDIQAICLEFKSYLNVGQSTWDKAYMPYLKKICKYTAENASLEEACLSAIAEHQDQSRGKQICITVVRRLYEFLQIPSPTSINLCSANYSSKNVKERKIPTKKEIEDAWATITNQQWKNAFALMAVFGIRNHEVFRSDVVAINGKVFCKIECDTKTGERLAFPYWPCWVEDFGISPGIELPSIKFSSNQRLGQQVALQFKRYEVGFSPYSLRHAYAIRTMTDIPDFLVARSLGHSVESLNKTYRHHFNQTHFLDAVMEYID